MAATTCGWCHRATHMTRVARLPARPSGEYTGDTVLYVNDAAYECDNCHRLSVVTWLTDYPSDREPEDEGAVRWNPPPGAWREFPDVPDGIGTAATEAWFCHSAGAYRAALAVARAVVEASAKHEGQTTGTLVERIDGLADAGKIRQDTGEAAHQVRLVGNEAAHGDLAASAITPEEAEEVLVLMDELLNELFQSKARRERVKAAREARKASNRD